MTAEDLAAIDAWLNDLEPGCDGFYIETRLVRALRDERGALLDIARAMADLDLEYTDEHLEYYCPACRAFVSADWGSNRKPYGMTGKEWAVHRMKHEADCPVVKARALVARLDGGVDKPGATA